MTKRLITTLKPLLYLCKINYTLLETITNLLSNWPTFTNIYQFGQLQNYTQQPIVYKHLSKQCSHSFLCSRYSLHLNCTL